MFGSFEINMPLKNFVFRPHEICFVQLLIRRVSLQFDAKAREGEGANCNRVIMFLTDGGTEMPEDIIRKHNWPKKKVRLKVVGLWTFKGNWNWFRISISYL